MKSRILIGMPLAERVRAALGRKRAIAEQKMFGGTCFLLGGHMLCAAGRHGFMFRVGRAQYAKALARRGASPVVMGGREFAGFVWVDPRSCDARALKRWIVLAEDYVGSLPPKRRTQFGARVAIRKRVVTLTPNQGRISTRRRSRRG